MQDIAEYKSEKESAVKWEGYRKSRCPSLYRGVGFAAGRIQTLTKVSKWLIMRLWG
jgi:hypothetical protein